MGRALRFPVEETYSSGIRETRRKRGCRAVTRSFNIAYRFARVRHFRKARRACLVKSGGSSPRGLVSKEHLARMKRPSDPRDTDGDAKSSRRASNATGDGRRFCDGIYFIYLFFFCHFSFFEIDGSGNDRAATAVTLTVDSSVTASKLTKHRRPLVEKIIELLFVLLLFSFGECTDENMRMRMRKESLFGINEDWYKFWGKIMKDGTQPDGRFSLLWPIY